MKRNRKTAIILAAMLLLIAIIASWIVFTFLPVSPERPSLTVGCLVVGIICSSLLYAVVTKLPDKRWVRVSAFSLFALFTIVPLASAAVPRITYSRFGFTVYGATPIPVLDITVHRHGVLWFRPKTHQITRAELDALIATAGLVYIGICRMIAFQALAPPGASSVQFGFIIIADPSIGTVNCCDRLRIGAIIPDGSRNETCCRNCRPIRAFRCHVLN